MAFIPEKIEEKTNNQNHQNKAPSRRKIAKRCPKKSEEAKKSFVQSMKNKEPGVEKAPKFDERTMQLMAEAALKLAEAGGDVDAERAALEALGVDTTRFEALMDAGFESLKKLAAGNAVFPLSQWEKGMLKKVGKEWSDHPQWGVIRKILASRNGIISLAGTDSPWGLHSFEKMIEMENEMMDLAGRERAEGWGLPQELVDAAFASRPTIAEEQKNAVIASSTGNKAVVVTEGTAGAGKSYSLDAVREIYQAAPESFPGEGVGYEILGTALSWSAAMVLKTSANLPASMAIDKLVSEIEKAREKGEEFFKRRTLLIVDEAGLVGTEHMLKLLKYSAESKSAVRVVLTGDSLQLSPVAAGNALEAIVDKYGSARLDTIRRQKQDSHCKAVKHFCFGRANHGLWTFLQQEAIHFCSNAKERFSRVVSDYLTYAKANPTKTALALGLSNEDVKFLNMSIRDAMKAAGRVVPPEYALKVTDGRTVFEARFAVGDQIVFRKNVPKQPIFKSEFMKIYEAFDKDKRDKAMKSKGGMFGAVLAGMSMAPKIDEKVGEGVFNRMGGVILSIKESRKKPGTFDLRVLLSEGGEVEVNTGDFIDRETKAVPLHHNFATTIYASQGQTVERVFILDSPQVARRLAYVGMSRHKELCDIYVDLEDLHERIAKKIDKAKEGAWRKFAKEREEAKKAHAEMKQKKEDEKNGMRDVMAKDDERIITEHESLIALKNQLNHLDEETKRKMKHSDYIRAMAEVWAADSPNMTVYIAKKRASERKGKSEDELFMPCRAPEDNPDDHPEVRYERPPGFGSAEDQHECKTMEQLCGSSEVSKELMERRIWTTNRFGEERIIGFGIDGEIETRYTTEGRLVAGDGTIPLIPNLQAHAVRADCPVLFVRTVKEASHAWKGMSERFSNEPENIPHVAIGFPESDWSTLKRWTENFRDKPKVYVGWKDSGVSLEWAISAREKLMDLGYSVSYFPRPPEGGLEGLVEKRKKEKAPGT